MDGGGIDGGGGGIDGVEDNDALDDDRVGIAVIAIVKVMSGTTSMGGLTTTTGFSRCSRTGSKSRAA
jgi:hypothetical protein